MPKLNPAYLNVAMQKIVRYVEHECFGKMMQVFSDSSPGALEDVINRLATHTANDSERKYLADLRFYTLCSALNTSRRGPLD